MRKKIQLLCLPYAGGSAAVFSKWRLWMGRGVELVPVELAGRGNRITEPLYQDLDAAVEDVFAIVRGFAERSPYALFGHSMGALMVYLVAQRLAAEAISRPVHFFFSGKGAPHAERKDEKQYHVMDEERFRTELIALGGTPPEFFEYRELMQIMLPVLKNDFRLVETWKYQGPIRRLDGDITIFLGKEDDLTPDQCEGWRQYTEGRCDCHYFDGGHFFLHDHAEQMMAIINKTLQNSLINVLQ